MLLVRAFCSNFWQYHKYDVSSRKFTPYWWSHPGEHRGSIDQLQSTGHWSYGPVHPWLSSLWPCWASLYTRDPESCLVETCIQLLLLILFLVLVYIHNEVWCLLEIRYLKELQQFLSDEWRLNTSVKLWISCASWTTRSKMWQAGTTNSFHSTPCSIKSICIIWVAILSKAWDSKVLCICLCLPSSSSTMTTINQCT